MYPTISSKISCTHRESWSQVYNLMTVETLTVSLIGQAPSKEECSTRRMSPSFLTVRKRMAVVTSFLRAILSIASPCTYKRMRSVNTMGLLDTITSLHERKDYWLCQTVRRTWDTFDAEEIDEITWISEKASLVDALTKHNQKNKNIEYIL